MHGATLDHRMFNAPVEAFAPEYRLLVWDARGHGQSQSIVGCVQLRPFAEGEWLSPLAGMSVNMTLTETGSTIHFACDRL